MECRCRMIDPVPLYCAAFRASRHSERSKRRDITSIKTMAVNAQRMRPATPNSCKPKSPSMLRESLYM